jgi:hypothetical protein
VGSECPTLACNGDGSCAAASDVLYVDNKNGACVGPTHAGTMADPYCQIQPAIAALATQHHIAVKGSTIAYASVIIGDIVVSLWGPGAVTPTAKITSTQSMTAAVYITGTTTNIAVDGFEVSGSPAPGIICAYASNTTFPKVLLRNLSVHDNAADGIDSISCNTTIRTTDVRSNMGFGIAANHLASTSTVDAIDLDRVSVGLNTKSGISSTASHESITNSMVFMDGAPEIALSQASAVFTHNTVVSTMSGPGTFSALTCAAAAQITDSIIWQGMTGSSGSSPVGPNCQLSFVDVNDPAFASANHNRNVQPDFQNANSNNFHLKGRTTNNLQCCVDQVTTDATTHDFFGVARPIHVLFDIGADEVPFP